MSRLPAREDQIRAQDAQVAAARAALARSELAARAEARRRARRGLVHDTFYREGEWVPAGSPVVRLLPPGNVKVRFFVPEDGGRRLKPGQTVRVALRRLRAPIAGEDQLHLAARPSTRRR